MTTPSFLKPGHVAELGSHTFEPEEIIRFAEQFDPQPFHRSEELAKGSVFGRLCASGWHTQSIWMKMLRKYTDRLKHEKAAEAEGYTFEFGPSPGFDNLKWIKPVFAGDTISYFNEIKSIRQSSSRPEWHIMETLHKGVNQNGEDVISFESAVLVRIGNLQADDAV